MMAMTPIGTAVFSITSPLGRSTRLRTAPTGSGRAATSRIPFAMPAIRSGLRASRSSITSEMRPRASSRSRALAARMGAVSASSSSAMASRARSLVCVSARAMAPLACLARASSSCVVIPSASLWSFAFEPRQARRPRNRVPTCFPSTIS